MEIDWPKYFTSRKKSKSKFEELNAPVPLGPDFEENTAIVMEWIWRCGRATSLSDNNENLLIPMRDRWFMVNHDWYEGAYFHSCDPRKMLMFYTRYEGRWERYIEHRQNPQLYHMIQESEAACRDALWGAFNCTGKNEHFWSLDQTVRWDNIINADLTETPKKMKANDTLEFFSCSKCQEAMPKPIVVTSRLKRSKLVDVGF
ncbi:MAG: hypothetical protein MN733_03930 [Nitrososphaera sp.]|nr:hypothetical protein [Nitrososphaera sp.]